VDRPVLHRIVVYPIKALDGVALPEARIGPAGGLAGDREFAMLGPQDRLITGKREARVHAVRAAYDLAARLVRVWTDGTFGPGEALFHLDRDRAGLEAWLAAFFGYPVRLLHDAARGFPDDSRFGGPTVVSTATLAAVATWFPGLTLDGARRRFRPNLELAAAAPFWEDRLVAPDGPVPFCIGAVRFEGMEPWPRCAVPTRDPDTGVADPSFQKTFSARRRAELPPWAPRERFDHFYRVCVGTRVPASEAGKVLRVGDPVALAQP
jgi:uncharacterized protein YcbX